ncbi:MAG: FixH family protein [Bacteroidia bacterium]
MTKLTLLKLPIFTLLIGGLLNLTACQPDEPDPFENLELIAIAEDGNAAVEVYANEALYAGYNTLYVKVINDGEETNNASVTIKPVMDMTEKVHSCPVEQPTLNDDNIFEGYALFQMPSMGGTWALNVNVTLIDNGDKHEFSMPIEVIQPEFARAIVTSSEIDDKRIIIGYVNPMAPTVGDNDFEVAVYTMVDMMTFEPITGLKVKTEPEMPSMGHGSEGNINPTETTNGHYKGNVNFNMVGDWRINLTVLEGDAVAKDGIYFDLFFQ